MLNETNPAEGSFLFCCWKIYLCALWKNSFPPKEELFDERITSNIKSLPTFFGEIGKIRNKSHYIVFFKQDKWAHTFIL